LLGKLAESSDQTEKDLVSIVKVFVGKPDIKTAFADNKENYEDLKKKLDKLNDYKKGDKYKNLGTEEKKAFELLVKTVGERVEELKKHGQTSNPTDPGKSF